MKIDDGDEWVIVLSTGRRLYACLGMLALPVSGPVAFYSIGSGDGQLWIEEDGTPPLEHITDEEQREIADHMIQRWQEWREAPRHA